MCIFHLQHVSVWGLNLHWKHAFPFAVFFEGVVFVFFLFVSFLLFWVLLFVCVFVSLFIRKRKVFIDLYLEFIQFTDEKVDSHTQVIQNIHQDFPITEISISF